MNVKRTYANKVAHCMKYLELNLLLIDFVRIMYGMMILFTKSNLPSLNYFTTIRYGTDKKQQS